jgi:hypothetical protein
VLAMAIVLGVAVAVFTYWSRQPGTVLLRFTAAVGDEALVFNEPLYANPGGSGAFSVRDFLMYLSNIQLVGAGGTYSVPDSYHLARFDNASNTYEILIEEVPRDTYSRVILSIGVDQQANASIVPVGDLDPNGRMAWNWEVGYKFVLFEGSLLVDGERRPLVYHVGFSENRRTLEFDLPEPARVWSPEGLVFRVDLMTLFAGNQTVDMRALSNVKFDRVDAGLLANNYASMISLHSRRVKKVERTLYWSNVFSTPSRAHNRLPMYVLLCRSPRCSSELRNPTMASAPLPRGTICCAGHSTVGFDVALKWRTRRLSWVNTRKT